MSAPKLIQAVAFSSLEVDLVFDQSMKQDLVFFSAASYSVLNNTVTNVTAAAPNIARITLGTEMVTGVKYIAKILGPLQNILAELINPSFKSVAFFGLGAPAVLVSIAMIDEETIEATWDQTIGNTGFFSFSGLSIVQVTQVSILGSVVQFKVKPTLLDGATYSGKFIGFVDEVGNKSSEFNLNFTAIGVQPRLSSVTHTPGSLLLTFNKEMRADGVLTSPGSYEISTTAPGAGPMFVEDVKVENDTDVRLTVTYGLDTALYTVVVNESVADVGGNTIDPLFDSGSFLADSPAPNLSHVVAIGRTVVDFVFSRPVRNDAAARDPSNYQVGALKVKEAEVLGRIVRVITAPQDPGLQCVCAIVNILDVGGNVFVDTSPIVTGWQPDAASRLQLYHFIYRSIRETDEVFGTGLLRRLCDGWQHAWERMEEDRRAIARQISPRTCDPGLLKFKAIAAGWTNDDSFLDSLTEQQLRKLLVASQRLWRDRGSESAYLFLIGLFTDARTIIRNWFWFRWVEGEVWLGDDANGWDSYLLDLPKFGKDPWVTQAMVVDDGTGTLNRSQVEHAFRRLRPLKETIQVAYVNYANQFHRTDDYLLLSTEDGVDIEAAIVNGELGFGVPPGPTQTVSAVCKELGDSVIYGRVKGDGQFGVEFRRIDADNRYIMIVDVSQKKIDLTKYVGGVPTSLATATDVELNQAIVADLWYGVRITVRETGAGQLIRVRFDAQDVFAVIDNDLQSGLFGVWHAVDSLVYCDELVAYSIPLSVVEIGP